MPRMSWKHKTDVYVVHFVMKGNFFFSGLWSDILRIHLNGFLFDDIFIGI